MIRNSRPLVIAVAVFAVAHLTSCSSANEESDVEYALGNEALATLDFQQALLHYNEAIRLNPEHAGAHLKRGQIRWQSNQYDASLPDLTRAIELDSTLTWAYFFRGVSLATLDRLEESVDDFGRVIDREEFETGDIVRALTWRSIALFKLGRIDESISDLNARVDLEPGQVIHRIDRGGAYQSVGETEKAIDDYLHVLEEENLDSELREIVAPRLTSLGVDVPEPVAADSASSASD
ncbi:MAG: tetratricopeptide repeat protein [Rhodothermia bacterium]|nr:tetratricopeptide repeat protein [Rhodothermia bacterium]